MRGSSVGAFLSLLMLGALSLPAAGQGAVWWSPGDGTPFPAQLDDVDGDGTTRLLLEGGPMQTKGHPFFEPKGDDGRACVTCHQPSDGMSLSAETARRRWAETDGKDPLFAAYDGSNCPDLPQGERASHSLLLDHGLIRIARPWPPVDAAGQRVEPDFTLELVRDPTGCNASKSWGMAAEAPRVSVFRRPRPVANFKYILAMGFAIDPKVGEPLPIDPATGQMVSGNLLSDRRVLSLEAQMQDAAHTHLGLRQGLTAEEQRQILDFELRLFVARQQDRIGGDLDEGGARGGPETLARSEPGRLGSQGMAVFSEFAAWEKIPADADISPEQRAYRESVARGARIFREKMFLITDSAGINSPVGFGNPVRNSCVFCHNMSQMGMDVAPGQVDLGTTNMPFADPQPHLPLFRVTCKGEPHPHYGRVIHTHDPGYALTTGLCADVGKITLQTLRGLTGRAPYFANGSARDLRAVIDYYERRYNIGYTEQEKRDLVNLMGAL
ncbi:hypothetical protein [Niveispirillum irakense]|uniref:hypothetical protein n=1 Tax=Niveispirillum irakense TaxID=34011 RepID=UPI000424ABBF|nr:hypothetical protein [Niveispirillum irakense]